MGRFSGLRVQLISLVLLAVVPALALVLYTAEEQRQAAGVRAHEDALRLARMVANDQQQWVESTRELLLATAQAPSVRAHDLAACGKLFSQILQECSCSLYSNLGAADLNGEVFCSAVPSKVQFSIAERSYFQRAVTNRDFSIGDYLLAPGSGQSVIPFAYPVFDDSGRI